jgi:hypothetical protein
MLGTTAKAKKLEEQRAKRREELKQERARLQAELRRVERRLANTYGRRTPFAAAASSGEHRELALQMVDIGFKALAIKLHPDRGGSHDEMERLNLVCDRLRQVAEGKR